MRIALTDRADDAQLRSLFVAYGNESDWDPVTDLTLNPPVLVKGTDLALGMDDKTVTFETAGLYVVSLALSYPCSADTVKALVSASCAFTIADADHPLLLGSPIQLTVPVDGAVAAGTGNNPQAIVTAVPYAFAAGDTVKVTGETVYRGGNVGTVDASLMLSIVRVA